MTTAETAAWAGVCVTSAAVLVALFKDDLRSLWRRPRLMVKLRMGAPDCQKTEMAFSRLSGQFVARGPCYYFRLWVENTGNLRADRVQVFVSRLLRRDAAGDFRAVTRFLPMNLKWANDHAV